MDFGSNSVDYIAPAVSHTARHRTIALTVELDCSVGGEGVELEDEVAFSVCGVF